MESRRTRWEKDLKNCPFCGGIPRFEMRSRGYVNGKSTKITYIFCTTCNCRTEKFDIVNQFTPQEGRILAKEQWNRRVGETDGQE